MQRGDPLGRQVVESSEGEGEGDVWPGWLEMLRYFLLLLILINNFFLLIQSAFSKNFGCNLNKFCSVLEFLV